MKKRTIIRSAAVLLTATMLTGCEIGNTEITFDIKHTNKHVAFAVNDTKCSIKEAKLYLCNYKKLRKLVQTHFEVYMQYLLIL